MKETTNSTDSAGPSVEKTTQQRFLVLLQDWHEMVENPEGQYTFWGKLVRTDLPSPAFLARLNSICTQYENCCTKEFLSAILDSITYDEAFRYTKRHKNLICDVLTFISSELPKEDATSSQKLLAHEIIANLRTRLAAQEQQSVLPAFGSQ